MSQKKIQFIVNPFSGGGKASGIVAVIESQLDRVLYSHEVLFTDGPGHATVLARRAVESGVDVVVAVGGDGTVNEVAAGMLHSGKPMGIIPAGSGNGLAMHLGIGRNMSKAIEIINKQHRFVMDTCVLNKRPYINLAGIGFDALIAYQTAHSKSRGFLAYAIQTIKSALLYKAKNYEIQLDNKEINKEALIVEVANAPMFGYNFTVAPLAKLNDGLLEVVLIRKTAKWRYLFLLPRFLNGSLHKSSLVERFKAKSVKIKLRQNAPVHVDGEGYLLDSDLQFSVDPLSLVVLASPKYSLSS